MRQVMPHRSNIVVRHLRCKSLLHKKAGHFLIAAAKGRGARGAHRDLRRRRAAEVRIPLQIQEFVRVPVTLACRSGARTTLPAASKVFESQFLSHDDVAGCQSAVHRQSDPGDR